MPGGSVQMWDVTVGRFDAAQAGGERRLVAALLRGGRLHECVRGSVR